MSVKEYDERSILIRESDLRDWQDIVNLLGLAAVGVAHYGDNTRFISGPCLEGVTGAADKLWGDIEGYFHIESDASSKNSPE